MLMYFCAEYTWGSSVIQGYYFTHASVNVLRIYSISVIGGSRVAVKEVSFVEVFSINRSTARYFPDVRLAL